MGGGGGGGQAQNVENQNAYNRAKWEFDWGQMENAAQYQLDQFYATKENEENRITYENQVATNEWLDKEAIRIFDYNNQVAAFNASVEAYEVQKDYNQLAAEITTNDNTRKYNERLMEIGFKNEDLLMNLGFDKRAAKLDLEAKKSAASGKMEEAKIEGLSQKGKILNMGQTGRSARKNLQAALAGQARVQSGLIDAVIKDEVGYAFTMEKLQKTATLGQTQLRESMSSARSQYDADQTQVALQQWSADLAAEAQLAPSPTLAPQTSPPVTIPAPNFVLPPDTPTQEQWQDIHPPEGVAASGGGSGFLSTVIGLAGQMAIASSDDRLKYNITRVGTSPSGIPKYTFKYRLDGVHGPKYMGTSAQDLIAMGRKDAVGQKEKDGFYYVDYSKLDVTMEVVTT